MKGGVVTLGVVLMACGPGLSTDSGGGDGSGSDGSTGSSSATTAMMTASTSTSLGDTTIGPAETGDLETGDPWDDLPSDCSVIEQDCPPGYKCMPWSNDGGNAWNDRKCVPIVPDPNAPGQPCTVEGDLYSGVDDCDGTSMCWDVHPESLEGECIPLCIGTEADPTCADLCDACALINDALFGVCLPTCDPVAQDCPRGQACFPVDDRFTCAIDRGPQPSPAGSPCEFVNVCDGGLACMSAELVPGCEASGCCSPFCDPTAGLDPCIELFPGTTCVPWPYEEQVPPRACVATPPGVCVVP